MSVMCAFLIFYCDHQVGSLIRANRNAAHILLLDEDEKDALMGSSKGFGGSTHNTLLHGFTATVMAVEQLFSSSSTYFGLSRYAVLLYTAKVCGFLNVFVPFFAKVVSHFFLIYLSFIFVLHISSKSQVV